MTIPYQYRVHDSELVVTLISLTTFPGFATYADLINSNPLKVIPLIF